MRYEYEVKEGDTLSDIIYNVTGNSSSEAYEDVARKNNISDPNLIIPGQKIIFDTNDYMTDTYKQNSIEQNQTTTGEQENKSASVNTRDNLGNSSSELNIEKEKGKNADTSSKNVATAIFEIENQDEIENILNKENNNASTNADKVELSKSLDSIKAATAATVSTGALIADIAKPSNGDGVYIPSDYEICYPSSVSGFNPRDTFKTFQIKENAGDHFVSVNNMVEKCGNDIDGIIAALNTLKTKMGDNTGTTSQIVRITGFLNQKKQDLITKNKELIEACYKVVDYVYENKTNKSQEASVVASTIQNINIYNG